MMEIKRNIDDSRDVFELKPSLPEHCCIVAPGYNGAEKYNRIDPGCYRIAINYGVFCPVKIDLWIVADWHGIFTDWFSRADRSYAGQRCFSRGMAERCEVWNPDEDMTFKLVNRHKIERGYKTERPTLTDKFRPDETSAGIAIDFACRFGAKRIDLIGVDMKGAMYYDGSISKDANCDRSDVWLFRDNLMDLIEWNRERYGVEFGTLSETALRVEPCSDTK